MLLQNHVYTHIKSIATCNNCTLVMEKVAKVLVLGGLWSKVHFIVGQNLNAKYVYCRQYLTHTDCAMNG